ncbi:class I tRNA ligase family protein, partial [bacterium]|nr:class I tRNA ligase family protein [bacterium]
WYLRRSRKRLWIEEKTEDKLAGYSTMYDVFLGLSKVLAPFVPFITEEIYLNLRTDDMPESVHLCDYRQPDNKQVDKYLEEGMDRIRSLVEVGRALRSKIGIKVRYPLSSATIVCDKDVEESIKKLLDLLNEEINVKEISFSRDTNQFMTKTVKPNHSKLGPKFKDKAKLVLAKLESLDKHKVYEELMKHKKIDIELDTETITLSNGDFEIIEEEKDQFARAEAEDMILFLDTTLTSELEAEGFAREIVRRIQSMRKELDLDVEDKISTEIAINKQRAKALEQWQDYIKGETRSKKITFVDKPSGKLIKKWKIDELDAEIGIAS